MCVLMATRPGALLTGVLDEDDRLCLFDISVAAFFLSYILIVMIVIVNIVLAVLLDEFLKAADEEKSVRQAVVCVCYCCVCAQGVCIVRVRGEGVCGGDVRCRMR